MNKKIQILAFLMISYNVVYSMQEHEASKTYMMVDGLLFINESMPLCNTSIHAENSEMQIQEPLSLLAEVAVTRTKKATMYARYKKFESYRITPELLTQIGWSAEHVAGFRYMCPVVNCRMLIRYPSCLEVHMRQHTGERPYQCVYCSNSFAYKTSLKTHTMTVHLQQKPFSCTYPQCTYTAVSQSLVRSHAKKKHKLLSEMLA